MAMIQFVQNYDDLSTDRGYQFKFYCDRCQNGHMSRFQPSVVGTAGSLLRAAGSLFGGVLGTAGNSAYEIQQAVGGKAHDDALAAAVDEARPNFTQCVRCGQWVCNEVCWNAERGLCVQCAPKTEVEVAAAQSEAQIEQIREKVRAKDQTAGLDLDRKMVARCPKCKAETKGGKFCPECGAPLAQTSFCTECGAEIPAKAKFCPGCGQART
jgi:membrane protease subunit (stomatin/prohibitin family)